MITQQIASESKNTAIGAGSSPFAATEGKLLAAGAITQEEFLLISQKRI